MKIKLVVTMILVMLSATIVLNSVRITQAQPTIKIGVIGPQGLPHWDPAGHKPAAEMARDEINAAGGINVSGTMHQIELIFGNEYAVPTPDPEAAAGEVLRLISEGAQFIIGGFRTECVPSMIEQAMDFQVPFFICGAATNELITDRVPVDYERYQYLFRVTPTNSTMLVTAIAAYLQIVLIPKLLPLYGQFLWEGAANPQIKIAVLTEDLRWMDYGHLVMSVFPYYPAVLGPYVNVTYAARLPENAEDISSYLAAVSDSGARICIHMISGRVGLTFSTQYGLARESGEADFLPLGINVLGQMQTHYTDTSTGCLDHCILAFSGKRTVIVPGKTDVFWDNFVAKTGAWPLYTAWGTYDAIYMLKEAIEAAGTTELGVLIPAIEATDRIGLSGRFRFTAIHDVYTPGALPYTVHEFGRPYVAQWQGDQKLEVVSPIDQPYSRRTKIPTWMYSLADSDIAGSTPTELTFNGKVDINDMFVVANAWQTAPGDSKWNKEADINTDAFVNINDMFPIANNWQASVTLPLVP